MSPLMTKGSAPKSPMNIHARPTAAYPSREEMADVRGLKSSSIPPAAPVAAMEITKFMTFSP